MNTPCIKIEQFNKHNFINTIAANDLYNWHLIRNEAVKVLGKIVNRYHFLNNNYQYLFSVLSR